MRESGFYWVRVKGQETWIVAEFAANLWWFNEGYEIGHLDTVLSEIDERKIERL